MPRRWMSGATRANPRGRQLICCSKPHDDIVLASGITARRPLRTTTRERRGRLLLLGKGAVLTHRLARPLAAESDDVSSRPARRARACSLLLSGYARTSRPRARGARAFPLPHVRITCPPWTSGEYPRCRGAGARSGRARRSSLAASAPRRAAACLYARTQKARRGGDGTDRSAAGAGSAAAFRPVRALGGSLGP
jgi:hypothetical protein